MFYIKAITQEEMKILFKKKIIKNTRDGVVGKDGWPTGYMTTRNKAYIQDKYVDIAKKLLSKNGQVEDRKKPVKTPWHHGYR